MSDDPTQAMTTVDRFEVALLGRLTQFEMPDDQFRAEHGMHPDDALDRVAELDIDTDTVHDIAIYVIIDEELGDDFDNDDERERVVSIGMFIYGWQTRFHNG